jgi:hypothetical protein
MQHEQVSLDQGTPLLRTDGLVLISNTVKGPRHVMYPFRTCYSGSDLFSGSPLPGRGVFASRPIPAGTVIDVSPVLVFSDDETNNHISKTCLDHYT